MSAAARGSWGCCKLAVMAACLLATAATRAQTNAPASGAGPAVSKIEHRVTVGIEGRLEVLLPAPELHAKPSERTSPITVRIASTRPHGHLVQYDLRYIGLVPGDYDLRQYLLREGAPAAEELPPLKVQVSGLLPEKHQGALTAHQPERIAAGAGYQWLMSGAVALWALAAIPILLARRRRQETRAAPASAPPATLAERLRPMVELASAGQLTADQQAQLERLLLSHWRQRLDLESLDMADALSRLRAHPEAGALLRGLEDWLHRRPGSAKVDIESVLAPYRHVEVDEARGSTAAEGVDGSTAHTR